MYLRRIMALILSIVLSFGIMSSVSAMEMSVNKVDTDLNVIPQQGYFFIFEGNIHIPDYSKGEIASDFNVSIVNTPYEVRGGRPVGYKWMDSSGDKFNKHFIVVRDESQGAQNNYYCIVDDPGYQDVRNRYYGSQGLLSLDGEFPNDVWFYTDIAGIERMKINGLPKGTLGEPVYAMVMQNRFSNRVLTGSYSGQRFTNFEIPYDYHINLQSQLMINGLFQVDTSKLTGTLKPNKQLWSVKLPAQMEIPEWVFRIHTIGYQPPRDLNNHIDNTLIWAPTTRSIDTNGDGVADWFPTVWPRIDKDSPNGLVVNWTDTLMPFLDEPHALSEDSYQYVTYYMNGIWKKQNPPPDALTYFADKAIHPKNERK